MFRWHKTVHDLVSFPDGNCEQERVWMSVYSIKFVITFSCNVVYIQFVLWFSLRIQWQSVHYSSVTYDLCIYIMFCSEAYFAFVLYSDSNNYSLIVCCVEHLCTFCLAPTHRLLTPSILTKHPISRHHRESVITKKSVLCVSWVF
jgi:hypothetical protein